jgi:hypothetical protein
LRSDGRNVKNGMIDYVDIGKTTRHALKRQTGPAG